MQCFSSLLCLLSWAYLCQSRALAEAQSREELLIGWQGETFKPEIGRAEASREQLQQAEANREVAREVTREATNEATAEVTKEQQQQAESRASAKEAASVDAKGTGMGNVTTTEAQGEAKQPSSGAEDPSRRRWIETVSWNPRAFIYHNLLTHEECDHLVSIGSQRVYRSMVVDAQTGQTKLDEIRTSYGGSFGRGEDPVIARVEEKIAEWTHLPPNYGEQIQILRYENGQKYGAHWDWFDDPQSHKAYLIDGNRYATALMYLSELEEGGETNMPLAEPIDPVAQKIEGMSPCASWGGISVRPHKGDVLLFFDMDVQGKVGDRRSLHTACPALKGTKWTATKWIHNKPYMGKFDALEAAGRCVDAARNCAARVAGGECASKASEMVGPDGVCRKSCADCTQCPPGDIICMRKNMMGDPKRRAAQAKAPRA